VADLVAAW
jgi:hypothetical protein